MGLKVMRRLKIVVVSVVLLLIVPYGTYLTFYAFTVVAYERMVAERPTNREEVRALLPGFRETQVLRREEMEPLFRDKLGEEMDYRRYTKYPGLPIDVVYDQDGRIDRVWPKFE
jgi:hypothetical protein